MNKLQEQLQTVVRNINIKDIDDINWEQLEKDITEQMPGCEIELFDGNDFANQWGCDILVFGETVVDAIARHTNIETVASDIWESEDEEVRILIVAIKTK